MRLDERESHSVSQTVKDIQKFLFAIKSINCFLLLFPLFFLGSKSNEGKLRLLLVRGRFSVIKFINSKFD